MDAATASPTSAPLPNGVDASSLGVSPAELVDGETPPLSTSAPTTESVGELALMRAVLVDAITCLSGRGIKPSHRARVAMQARAWIARRGRDSLFAFDTICDALELDGEKLRWMLLAPRSSKSAQRQDRAVESFFLTSAPAANERGRAGRRQPTSAPVSSATDEPGPGRLQLTVNVA